MSLDRKLINPKAKPQAPNLDASTPALTALSH